MSKPERDSGRSNGVFSALAALVGGWIVYSNVAINHRMPLPKALDAEVERFTSEKARFLSYYVDRSGSGRPLLLIHSINAAANSVEMYTLFEHYRGSRPVYALDLPGFGFSERADREYSPRLYTDAIVDMLARLGEPADVIALSLSSEFAARAACEHPERFHSLTVISPSGLTGPEMRMGSQKTNRIGASDIAHRILSFPLWARPLFDLLATKPSIHWFLSQSFEGQVDAKLENYDYLSAHQPGAHHAPLYFISGKLFSLDIYQTVYEQLTVPTLILFDRDPFVRFDKLPQLLQTNPNWRATRIAPTKGLAHLERIDDVARALDSFWQDLA